MILEENQKLFKETIEILQSHLKHKCNDSINTFIMQKELEPFWKGANSNDIRNVAAQAFLAFLKDQIAGIEEMVKQQDETKE